MSKSVIRNCEKYDKIGSIETCVEDGFTMTAVGDLIVSRVMTKGKLHGFDEVVKLLQSTGADVTFGNFEGSIFDIRHFHGSPQAEYGGAYHVSVPAVAVDLRKMGFEKSRKPVHGPISNHQTRIQPEIYRQDGGFT